MPDRRPKLWSRHPSCGRHRRRGEAHDLKWGRRTGEPIWRKAGLVAAKIVVPTYDHWIESLGPTAPELGNGGRR